MACTEIEIFELAYHFSYLMCIPWFRHQPFILKHQYTYSPYCSSHICLGAVRENLFDNRFL